MTVAELIKQLQEMPQDAVVTDVERWHKYTIRELAYINTEKSKHEVRIYWEEYYPE